MPLQQQSPKATTYLGVKILENRPTTVSEVAEPANQCSAAIDAIEPDRFRDVSSLIRAFILARLSRRG